MKAHFIKVDAPMVLYMLQWAFYTNWSLSMKSTTLIFITHMSHTITQKFEKYFFFNWVNINTHPAHFTNTL
jgi:hypothetical protein